MPDSPHPSLPIGKLATKLLTRVLPTVSQPTVLVGPASGEDAAVVAGGDTLVVTCDPITFAQADVGVYLIAVNCNDIVAMGGVPRYLMTTFLLPPGTTEQQVADLFREVSAASKAGGLAWIGGHTEVTRAVAQVVAVGTVIGDLSGPPLHTGGMRPGDWLLLTKWVGLEGTTTLARQRPAETKQILGEAGWREAAGWLHDPGIGLATEGRLLQGLALSAAHDPTEGGVATGIHELAAASKVGVRVISQALPIRPETAALCRHYGIDPLGLLGSGALLAAGPLDVVGDLQERLRLAGVPATVIGQATAEPAVVLHDSTGERLLPRFTADEIIRVLQRTRPPTAMGLKEQHGESDRR